MSVELPAGEPQAPEQLAAISWCRSHAYRTTERAVLTPAAQSPFSARPALGSAVYRRKTSPNGPNIPCTHRLGRALQLPSYNQPSKPARTASKPTAQRPFSGAPAAGFGLDSDHFCAIHLDHKRPRIRTYLVEGFSKMCWAGPEPQKQTSTQKPKNERLAQKQRRAVTETRESGCGRPVSGGFSPIPVPLVPSIWPKNDCAMPNS